MADYPDHNVSYTLVGICITLTLGLSVAQTLTSNVSTTCEQLDLKNVNITTYLTNMMGIQDSQSSGSSISRSVFIETFNEKGFFLFCDQVI